MTIRAKRPGGMLMPAASHEQITSLTVGQATSMSREEDAPGPQEKHIARDARPVLMSVFPDYLTKHR